MVGAGDTLVGAGSGPLALHLLTCPRIASSGGGRSPRASCGRGILEPLQCSRPAVPRVIHAPSGGGVSAGFKPLLVMHVWGHAFMRDYQAAKRGKHMATLFPNND